MVEVKFYDEVEDSLLKFAVIIAKREGKWIFCKHGKRNTWEIPGGRRKKEEEMTETAKRELHEETGALHYNLSKNRKTVGSPENRKGLLEQK